MPCDRVNNAAAVVLAALLWIFGPGAAADTLALTNAPAMSAVIYVTGADDLPLMDGLVEVPDGTLIFDKPEGRIVEFLASGSMDWRLVAGFYRDTLPQLGWADMTRGDRVLEFGRDGESLGIYLDGRKGGGTAVRFTIAPRPAAKDVKGFD